MRAEDTSWYICSSGMAEIVYNFWLLVRIFMCTHMMQYNLCIVPFFIKIPQSTITDKHFFKHPQYYSHTSII